MIHVHELLFNGQVMISDGQHRYTIFEFFRSFSVLLYLVLLFLAVWLSSVGQVVHQQGGLDDYDGLVGVKHRVIVSTQLT